MEGRGAFPLRGVSVKMAANCCGSHLIAVLLDRDRGVAVGVASSSTTDFLKRKHHHSFRKDVDILFNWLRFIAGPAEAKQ